MSKLLSDFFPVKISLAENSNSGRVVVRGEFARAGIATENKRIYPGRIWEKEIGRLRKHLQERQLFGELDHPSDGRTQLSRVSHIVTDMRLENGIVVGEAEILDTERGKNLRALLQAGCRVGVSSRGYGSTRPNEKGEDVVQEDYRLVTFDFVAEPADSTAYPEVFFESRQASSGGRRAMFEGKEIWMETEKDLDMADEWARRVEKAKVDERDRTRADLKEEFARDMLEQISQMKAGLAEQIRKEMLADPEVAAAKTVLDQIKTILRPFVLSEEVETDFQRMRNQVSEKDLKIRELEDQVTHLSDVAKEVGYKFFLERNLSGNPDSDLIRNLVGNVKKYASSGELKDKVESIQQEIQKKRDHELQLEEKRKRQERELEERLAVEAQAFRAQEEQLRLESQKLREALEKSVQGEKELALRLYAERKLQAHPKANKIRGMLESLVVSSKEDIDRVFEQFKEPVRDIDELERARTRVRSWMQGGESNVPVMEERVAAPSGGSDAGVDINEYRVLAGISGRK